MLLGERVTDAQRRASCRETEGIARCGEAHTGPKSRLGETDAGAGGSRRTVTKGQHPVGEEDEETEEERPLEQGTSWR